MLKILGIMIYRNTFLFAFFSILLFFTGCQPDGRRNIPDVSGIEVDIEMRRFEKALFSADTTRMEAELARLQQEYPEFSAIYFNQILGLAGQPLESPEAASFIKGFITFPAVRQLYDTCMVRYDDMAATEQGFEQAFRFFRYYFPEEPLPTVTTYISEYTYAAFVYGQNGLAVGLDFFLGEDYPYLQYNPGNPAFSAYLTRTFTPEHLLPKTIRALADGLVPPANGERLLDLMVRNGKLLYVLDLLLPHTPDSIKMEVTARQMQWLEENELEMWAYFLKEELLYSSNWQDIRKLVEYSPNSPGMPPEAPGRTANWVGWQIVEAYMEKYPETELRELLQMQDAQALLDLAKYRPVDRK